MDENWNEKLREYCALGDLGSVQHAVRSGKIEDINSQNKVNGWTALHWASKRNHLPVVKYLIEECKADPLIKNCKGDKAIDLCNSASIIDYLSASSSQLCRKEVKPETNTKLNFVPNYLANPSFIYAEPQSGSSRANELMTKFNNDSAKFAAQPPTYSDEEIVLKIRNASSDEQDFIEVELSRKNLTFRDLVTLCCAELQINIVNIKKIRKLPNTIVRKDKDVQRLKDYQEIEIVLS